MIRSFSSLYDLLDAFPDEQACVDHLRAIRRGKGAFCPHCGSTKVYDFSDKRTHKCGDCRQRFSIKVGTIFEGTKLPLRKWFVAIWMVTSHKKGIASTQLAKDLKITQKSAWFVLHRLRYAARTNSFSAPLSGEVEVVETAVGGKEKNKHESKRLHQGRGSVGKGDCNRRAGAWLRAASCALRCEEREGRYTSPGRARSCCAGNQPLHARTRGLPRPWPRLPSSHRQPWGGCTTRTLTALKACGRSSSARLSASTIGCHRSILTATSRK